MSDLQEFTDVPCPFCGLLCDDLHIAVQAGAAAVRANGCARSRQLFAAGSTETASAAIAGKGATFEQALAHAIGLLRGARRPLYLAAGTDVAGMRALIELAERTRGIVDHVNSEAMFRNLRVLQDTGWMSTTLTEVRNRADLMIVAGSEIGSRFPRLFERCFGEFDTLFGLRSRELVVLGEPPENLPDALRRATTCLAVKTPQLAEFFAALRALLGNRSLQARTIAGVSVEQLAALAVRMRNARYGVLTWAAAELDYAHADLAVQSMCEVVRELNAGTRFSVLPLGGSDGDVTAQQITTWQTGFPVGVEFSDGMPAPRTPRSPLQTPARHADADVLVYVCAIDPARTMPETGVPSIVIGRAGMRPGPCEVFIPVGVPGLHHAGHLFRSDTVVALRMRALAPARHPPASAVLQRFLDTLEAD